MSDEVVSAEERFVSMVAHELRSPVQALLLQLDATLRMSQKDAREPEWFRGRVAKALDRVRGLAELLDKFLDLSKIHEGRIDLVIEPLDLVAVTNEVIRTMADELAWARCPVELRAPAQILGAWDRTRVQAIITNLLGNARKYAAGQPIVVTLGADDREARIEVQDHGPGIAAEQQARIFERFERVFSAATARISGMGLGLWIVRQFVEAHGGTIRVENVEGAGAQFTVTLPLRRPEVVTSGP